MSYPRAQFPPDVIAHYQAHGFWKTCKAYRCSFRTLRRWLVERGVAIRPHGRRDNLIDSTSSAVAIATPSQSGKPALQAGHAEPARRVKGSGASAPSAGPIPIQGAA